MAFNKNKIIHGTNGRIYVDGVELAEVESCDAKVSNDYEELSLNGKFTKVHRYLSSSISGTVTVKKWNSWLLSQYKSVGKSGIVPEVTITITISDPQTSETQSVALYNVSFTEMDLGGFENAALKTEEMPFVADSFEVLATLDND